jgi:hypothetical protein
MNACAAEREASLIGEWVAKQRIDGSLSTFSKHPFGQTQDTLFSFSFVFAFSLSPRRNLMRHMLATMVVLCSFLAVPVCAFPADQPPLWPVEQKLLDFTNAQRTYYGLAPLTLDETLLKSARSHCFWMASARNLQHTSSPVAENIAMGQRTTSEAITSWMNSPGHRANMLNGSYRRLGMAAYETHDGVIYWCLQFLP